MTALVHEAETCEILGAADEHRAQMQNYLHATKLRVGLLVNFGHFPKVEHERFVL